jgi:hypothetical protein
VGSSGLSVAKDNIASAMVELKGKIWLL